MTRAVASKKRATDSAAEAGVDYDSINTELTFSGIEVDFSINIREDDQSEGEEKFEVYLSDPSPSSTHYLAFPYVLTVIILDNEQGVPGDGGSGGDGGSDDGR